MDVRYETGELGGKRSAPDVGRNLALRYHFWNNIGYMSCCSRELVALGYYWLRGWI